MQTIIFYGIALLLLSISFAKDREKTKLSLRKAWKSLENILPQLLNILIIISILLAYLNTEFISAMIGEHSGMKGVLLAAAIGSITMIPPFVAFPTAALLLEAGAGYMQIGAFISTLTMVGIITMPVEIKYFGKKLTFLRNLLSFFFAFIVAYIIAKVVGI